MQYINLLLNSEFKATSRSLGYIDKAGTYKSRTDAGKEMFADVEFSYDADSKSIVVNEIGSADSSGWMSEDEVSGKKVDFLSFDSKRSTEINGVAYNSDFDVAICTDKIRFIEGVPAYFRFVPFNGGMLISLYGGAVQVFVIDEWVTLQREGTVINKNSYVYDYTKEQLTEYAQTSDRETFYNMTEDGSSLVEVVVRQTKDGKALSCKSAKDLFVLLRDDGLNKAKKKYQEKELSKSERHTRMAELQAEYNKSAAKRAEEEAKRKTKKSGPKQKSPEERQAEASIFRNFLKANGFNR